jgi:hypothetical protein
LDTLPSEEAIASVVALELAHVELGHGLDTKYAFDDRLVFPDSASFQNLVIRHTEDENKQAAKRAMEYLRASMYKDLLANAGLYWEQLSETSKTLMALTTPRLGDSLLQKDGRPWLSDLAKSAPQIDERNLNQVAALALGSWLATDPMDGKVSMLDAKRFAPTNAREKVPFDLTPLYFRLERLQNAHPAGRPAQTTVKPSDQPKLQMTNANGVISSLQDQK